SGLVRAALSGIHGWEDAQASSRQRHDEGRPSMTKIIAVPAPLLAHTAETIDRLAVEVSKAGEGNVRLLDIIEKGATPPKATALVVAHNVTVMEQAVTVLGQIKRILLEMQNLSEMGKVN